MAKKRSITPSYPSSSNGRKVPIPLAHPDRSDPTAETLISWAEERNLFGDATKASNKTGEDGEDEEDYVPGRFAESILWSLTLTMVHFTLDYLVQHQYAQEIVVRDLAWRGVQALPVILPLFYLLHPHATPLPPLFTALLPIPDTGTDVHTLLFFATSAASGSYLIHMTNTHPYYAVMKQAAPVGCIWIWSVVELSLIPAVVSLLCCVIWLFWKDYNFVKVA